MSRARTLALLVLVIAGTLVATRYRGALAPDPSFNATGTTSGRAKPTRNLTVRNRNGTERNLAVPPGKLLLLHFWGTFCPPCVEELPGLLAYARSIRKDSGIELLAVSVDEDFRIVDDWLRKRSAEDLPIALDPRRETAASFGTTKFPETWLLSPSGEILAHVAGPLDWSSAETRRQIDTFRKGGTGTASPRT